MKFAHTFRRRKDIRHLHRPAKVTRPDKRTWERTRYEQAPEMIGHMLHVR